jgi:hypothetical protein
MKSCPENADPLTCGIAAIEFLIDGGHIAVEKRERGLPIVVDEFGKVALNESLRFHFARGNDEDATVWFKCLTCRRHIMLSNEFNGLYAELEE